jgi:hypothetical protein
MSGAFTRQVDVFVSRALSPQARSAALAEAARRGVADLISSGRAPPRYRRFVDGVEGAAESAVKPDGAIVYRFEYLAEVITFALGYLQGRAPTGSGAFRRGFFLGLDGKFVRAAAFNPQTMGPVREVMIGNVEPYNRLVDVQRAGTRVLKYRVPPDLYADAVRTLRGRFGKMVEIRRVYDAQFPGQYLLQSGKRAGKRVQSPALMITVR